MIINDYYRRLLLETLIEDDKAEAGTHPSEGRLSASMLGEPLQWQVLKMYGFTKVIDPYILGKFLRGKEVEKTYLQRLSRKIAVMDMQKEVEYRSVIGHMDAKIDTSGSPMNVGIIPFEVKSVANAKYARLVKEGKPQRGHLLQAACYALAEQSAWFSISYVSGEDYRDLVFMDKAEVYKPEIDRIVDEFNHHIIDGTIPVFEPPEAWMSNPKYNKFPDWSNLSYDECQAKLKEHLKNIIT